MITIVDYGMGNLSSVQKAVEFLGQAAIITSIPKEISKAEKLILPGVGAFAQAMQNLKAQGLLDPLKDFITKGRPFLGICLGMQLLMSKSEEHGPVEGLNSIPGTVKNFRSAKSFPKKLSVPQIGWNEVKAEADPLFKDIPKAAQFYFVHSYYAKPTDKKNVLGITDYGLEYCSVLKRDNVYGVQFHPEKSGRVGLQLLKNFMENC